MGIVRGVYLSTAAPLLSSSSQISACPLSAATCRLFFESSGRKKKLGMAPSARALRTSTKSYKHGIGQGKDGSIDTLDRSTERRLKEKSILRRVHLVLLQHVFGEIRGCHRCAELAALDQGSS